MLPPSLHAPRRDRPERLLGVDLLRSGTDDFLRARGRQDRELERPRCSSFLRAHLFQKGADLVVGQRRVMLAVLAIERRGQELVQVPPPARGVLARPVAPHPRVVEDVFDASAEAARRFGLGRPDRLEHAKHQGRINVAHGELADDRRSVGVECVLPLLGVLVVSPARPVRGDVFLRALGEGDRARLAPPLLVLAALACREGVDPFGELPAGLGGLGARLSKAHIARGAQAHPAPPALPCVTEDPALALRGTHLQVESPALPVVTRGPAPLQRLRREPLYFSTHATPRGPSYSHSYPYFLLGLSWSY